jgi:GT2 family glycosyltransferase
LIAEISSMPALPRRPTVSVVIPAFNAESSIDAALESVFAQSYPHLEVVVVDDGSSDGTAGRLETWRGRVQVIRQANGGPGRARNAGIRATSGTLIAFLDADDTWLPGKLDRQVSYFERYPQTGFLHTAALHEREPPHSDSGQGSPDGDPPRGAFCDLFHTDLDVNTLTVMVPRAVLDRVGLFDERREIHVEDWDLWLRIASRYPVGYLAGATAVRGAGGAMSGALEKTFGGQATVIGKTIPLCDGACPVHAARASACLRRRWRRFHWERGYARLRAGDTRGARASFLSALRCQPLDAAAWRHLGSTFLPVDIRHAARRLRRNRQTAPAAQDLEHRASLLHDTVYRRVRRTVAEYAHDVDDLLSRRDERRRILFQAATPMSFVIFRPVYERLEQDPRLEFWFTAVGSTWSPGALFERLGIRERVIPARSAMWMKVDACVNTDFWDTTWLWRRTLRLHLFHGVAGKYGLDAPLDLAPIVAAYDRLFFPNQDRLDRYVNAGLVWRGGRQVVLAGYPKVDRLVDGTLDADATRSDLALDRRCPTVIYAPTWSPHSSLNRCGEAVVDRLAAAGLNVIVKLHDRSYDLTPRGSGGVDWAARLARFEGRPNVRVVTDPDSTPYLAVSDAMVTDHSSVGFEFALLDRPIVVIDCPELIAGARVTRSKVVELRAAAEVVSSADEVVEAVLRQLEAPCLHSDERRALASRYFYSPGTATARVAAAIYDVLGLAAPAATTVETPEGSTALAAAR